MHANPTDHGAAADDDTGVRGAAAVARDRVRLRAGRVDDAVADFDGHGIGDDLAAIDDDRPDDRVLDGDRTAEVTQLEAGLLGIGRLAVRPDPPTGDERRVPDQHLPDFA